MNVYLYQNNTEKILKNIYIGEYGWQPGSNTVLYYSFDNDTASTSYDGVGSNNGTWANSSGTYTTGVKGKCAEFTSTLTKYLAIPTTFTFPTTNFTISFFARYTDNTSSSKTFFSKRNGGYNSTNAYLYIYQTSGKIGVDIPYVATLFTTTNTYNDGNWHHIALTKSGNDYKLYIDTVLINTASNSFALHGGSNTQALLGKNNSPNVGIDGAIDEFIVEDIAWTQQYIQNYIDSFN